MEVNFHKDIYLEDLSYYVPERVVTNQEIIDANSLKMKADWLSSRVGINERRWARADQSASDLAVEAIKRLKRPFTAGALFVSTISPDFLTPSTASVIKQKLGLTDSLPGIDMSAACAGQIFALEQAAFRMSASKDSDALVVATEVRSRYLDPTDRRTVFLFADAASCWRLSRTSGIAKLDWTLAQTRASEDYEILVPGGGSKEPLTSESVASGRQFIRMNDGAKIVDATNTQLVDGIRSAVEKSGSKIEDYDFFVFHQGNGSIIRAVAKTLGVREDQTWVCFDRFGNSSSASCGVAFGEAFERGAIHAGSRVLLVAMGAGYHVGMASFSFTEGFKK
ncbi:MAG TPA: ketoacyl-ACP synthase III [Bdellovibrionales bacterium]|nr:ketoacyl-ACP synthase III [Bdellovibrionales bacterium]